MIFFVLTTPDEIVVYSDRIKYSNGSFIKFLERNKTFEIAQIESIQVTGNYRTADELYSSPISGATKALNQLEIKFKNGEVEVFKTGIYINKLKRVIDEVEKLTCSKQ